MWGASEDLTLEVTFELIFQRPMERFPKRKKKIL